MQVITLRSSVFGMLSYTMIPCALRVKCVEHCVVSWQAFFEVSCAFFLIIQHYSCWLHVHYLIFVISVVNYVCLL